MTLGYQCFDYSMLMKKENIVLSYIPSFLDFFFIFFFWEKKTHSMIAVQSVTLLFEVDRNRDLNHGRVHDSNLW